MIYNKKINVSTVLEYLILVFILFITIYPIIYMLSISLSENIHVLRNDISFYPKGLNFRMYEIVLRDKRIFIAYKNTIIYVLLGTALSLSLTCAGAYALSKKRRLPFATGINIMILITMFFSGGMIPIYLTVVKLGLYDSIWAVVLPPCINAWNLIIMRTFFAAFPKEMEDSGRIDGLNDIGVLWYLVLPTSTAVLATIGLFYGVAYWNSFFGPFIYLKSQSKYPLQVILREIVLLGLTEDTDSIVQGGKDIIPEDSIKYTTIIISIIPVIAIYPFLQKYFVKGIMIGSVKG